MISCIICSRQPDVSEELKENIASTIGCEYELVVIDNSKGRYSIYSAYNEGVRLAKGTILCFMHEDILFHTNNWGQYVLKYFDLYKDLGLLGVVGTHFLSSIPGGWWGTKIASSHLLRGMYEENGKYVCEEVNDTFFKRTPTRVVSVDGLWMCIPKQLFEKLRWDENTFTGFHGYDLDISLQVWNEGLEVHVFWDVLIEHKSMGNAGIEFHNTYEKIWKKWEYLLPLTKGVEISSTECELRTEIARLERELRIQEFKLRSSYAYQLGKFLLTPLKWVKNINLVFGKK